MSVLGGKHDSLDYIQHCRQKLLLHLLGGIAPTTGMLQWELMSCRVWVTSTVCHTSN